MDGPDNVSIPYRYGIYNSEVVVDKAATEEGFNSLQVWYLQAATITFEIKSSSFNSLQVWYLPIRKKEE